MMKKFLISTIGIFCGQQPFCLYGMESASQENIYNNGIDALVYNAKIKQEENSNPFQTRLPIATEMPMKEGDKIDISSIQMGLEYTLIASRFSPSNNYCALICRVATSNELLNYINHQLSIYCIAGEKLFNPKVEYVTYFYVSDPIKSAAWIDHAIYLEASGDLVYKADVSRS